MYHGTLTIYKNRYRESHFRATWRFTLWTELKLAGVGFPVWGHHLRWLTYSIRQKSFARPTHPGLSAAFSHTPFVSAPAPRLSLSSSHWPSSLQPESLVRGISSAWNPVPSLWCSLNSLWPFTDRDRGRRHFPEAFADLVKEPHASRWLSEPHASLLHVASYYCHLACVWSNTWDLSPHRTALCRLCLFLYWIPSSQETQCLVFKRHSNSCWLMKMTRI